MKVQELWSYPIPITDSANERLTGDVWSFTYNFDGSLIYVASSNSISIFNSLTGELMKITVTNHNENIHAIALSRDGRRLATGSLDKIITIWNGLTLKPEGKFSLADGIQTISFNPLTYQLFAGCGAECLIWTPDTEKAFERKGHSEKILCSNWSPDGTTIAFGDQGGSIYLRDNKMKDKIVIQRKAPVWCIDWTPLTPENTTTLIIVGSLDKSVSIYDESGSLKHEVKHDINLYSLQCFGGGDFFVGGGEQGKAFLFSRKGVLLEEICSVDEWIWCLKIKPKTNVVTIGTNNGTIRTFKLIFTVVHGLYKNHYLYRDMLTDVVIRNLSKDQQFRLECRELIKKVSVYQEAIAIQLPSKIFIYKQTTSELTSSSVNPNDQQSNFKFGLIQIINKKLDCSLLVLTSAHLVICLERKLQLYTWTGNLVREWSMESMTRYLKVLGGPGGRESLLVGLKNGNVYKIFITTPFPVLLIQHKVAIRCVDLNCSLKLLAVVDENSNLIVYNLETKDQLYMEMNVSSVSWNSDMEDLLAYSGSGMLYIKAGTFPPVVQKQPGCVVGFQGSKLYVIHDLNMVVIEVAQTNSLIHYMEKKDYKTAFKVANLGLTEQDFRILGIEALCNCNFEVARKCFVRIKDSPFIDLVNKCEREKTNNTLNEIFMQAEVLAYQNKLEDAGNLLIKAGMVDKAVELFLDTRQFKLAARCFPRLSSLTNKNDPNRVNLIKIFKEEAEWAKKMGDWSQAADLFMTCEEFKKAIEILGNRNEMERLISLCRTLDKNTHNEEIKLCAQYFKKNNNLQYTKEAYLKLGDSKQLLDAYIEMNRWDEAMVLAKGNPEFSVRIKLPYAEFLAKSDRFEEAQILFKEAGRPELSMKIVDQLCKNAISEFRFGQVGSFYWNLAKEHLRLIENWKTPSQEDKLHMSKFDEYNNKADIYSAYKVIHNFVETPVIGQETMNDMKNMFNAARFILSKWNSKHSYPGINKSYLYYTLGKVSQNVGAFKTSRMAFERLTNLRFPNEWAEEVDLCSLMIRSKPFSDSADCALVCMRCMNQNLTVAENEICNTCYHPYLFSASSYEAIPLVEFEPENQSLTHNKLLEHLYSEFDLNEFKKNINPQGDGWRETYGENQQTLIFSNRGGGGEGDEDEDDTPFLQKLNKVSELQLTKNDYIIVKLNDEELKSLSFDEILWVDYRKYNSKISVKYYKNMVPDVGLVNCSDCGRFFLMDEFELYHSKHKKCPFCFSTTSKFYK